jgi:hypothetical protein
MAAILEVCFLVICILALVQFASTQLFGDGDNDEDS